MTAFAPELTASQGTGHSEVHTVCCNPDVAMCGTDVSDSAWVDSAEEATCVVCWELESQPCPRCGQ